MSNARYGLLLPDGRTEEQLSAKQLRLLELSNRAHRRAVEGLAGRSFTEREKISLAVANESTRKLLEKDLNAVEYPEYIRVNGQLYKKHETGAVDYHSLCGALGVTRATFRLTGKHNGSTIVPLELEAGIIEKMTPALAYAVASSCADGTDRQCEEQLQSAHRRPPSRSTIERGVKEMGGSWKDQAEAIESKVRMEEDLPPEAHAVSVGLDRTTVPMEEPRPEDEPVPSRRRKRTKPYVRKAPPRVDVNYRMAYVATVSIVDLDGQSIIVRRYAASASEGPERVVARMCADVQHIRELQSDIPVGITQDGAPELWNLVRSALDSIAIKPSHECVDRYHFDERKSLVLGILEKTEEKANSTPKSTESEPANEKRPVLHLILPDPIADPTHGPPSHPTARPANANASESPNEFSGPNHQGSASLTPILATVIALRESSSPESDPLAALADRGPSVLEVQSTNSTSKRSKKPKDSRSKERTKNSKDWNDRFDTDDTAIDKFEHELLAQLAHPNREKYTDKELETLEENRTFIKNNKDRLRYASIREAGLPEGSGATEGSCKSLVSLRAKRSGQRWHPGGLDAILAIRSTKMSQRLPPFWEHFAKGYTKDVQDAA